MNFNKFSKNQHSIMEFYSFFWRYLIINWFLSHFKGFRDNLNQFWIKSTYFIEIFPNILWCFHINIRIFTNYGKNFFLLKGIFFEIVEDSFLNSGNLRLFIRFYVILPNINQILKDLNVIYEIFTDYYSRYQDNTEDFNNFSKITL
jgi:hypothetical protein